MIQKSQDPVVAFERAVLVERVANRFATLITARQTLTPEQVDRIDEGRISFFDAVEMIRKAYPDHISDQILDLMMGGSPLRSALAGVGV
jgi:hypothetical protein